jgi:hypothetical protein
MDTKKSWNYAQTQKHGKREGSIFIGVFWSPWFIASWCIVTQIISASLLYIGRDESLPNPNNIWALISSTIILSISFIISLAAIIDMMVLCFFVPKDEDIRLTVPLLILIPLARVVTWGGLFFILWGWDPQSWNGVLNMGPFVTLIRLISHTASFIVIQDANTTLVHAFAGIFSYELYIIIVPVIVALCVTYVSEHTKSGEHKAV